jgi:hypothetical protein
VKGCYRGGGIEGRRHTLAESDDEDADMVSLPEKRTGIHNMLFAKGYAGEHPGSGIKRAVDAPDSLTAASAKAFMSIGNDLVTSGYIPPKLVEGRKQFIEPNREAFIDYWECRVDTTDFLGRIVSGFERMRKRQTEDTGAIAARRTVRSASPSER